MWLLIHGELQLNHDSKRGYWSLLNMVCLMSVIQNTCCITWFMWYHGINPSHYGGCWWPDIYMVNIFVIKVAVILSRPQLANIALIVRSCKVSKPQDWFLQWSYHSKLCMGASVELLLTHLSNLRTIRQLSNYNFCLQYCLTPGSVISYHLVYRDPGAVLFMRGVDGCTSGLLDIWIPWGIPYDRMNIKSAWY